MKYFIKILSKLKEYISGQSRKKLVENSVIIIIIGIIAIIAGSTLFKDNKEKSTFNSGTKSNEQAAAKILSSSDKGDQEKKVETILSKINGAGNVNVMITYISGNELVPAYDTKKSENETQEKDSGGGTRSIKSSDAENKVVYEDTGSGQKKPVVIKELQPEVKGVVVVADGAGDPVIKESLARAVQVLLDVPIHKVQVFQRNK